jgi:hypothetical protein
MGRGAPRGTAELYLDHQGGRLSSDTLPFGVRADIRFDWREVEKVERVRIWGLPFVGEGVRFLSKRTPTRNSSRRFVFHTRTKERALDVIGCAENNGVEVDRDAKSIMGTSP